MTTPVVINARDLGKSFAIYSRPADLLRDLVTGGSHHRVVPALRGVTFQVRAGESLGVLGRNGAGKSTLLRLVAGTLEPTTGRVQVQGRVSAILELGTGFDPQQTGRTNIVMGGLCLGMTERQVRQRSEAIVEFAELREVIDQPLRTYSTGMAARLAFAVAISVEPEILIVDEALSVGDARFQLRCADRIMQLRRQGCTFLFVSHSVEQVTAMCDRALVLERGRLHADASAAEGTALYHRLLFGGAPADAAGLDPLSRPLSRPIACAEGDVDASPCPPPESSCEQRVAPITGSAAEDIAHADPDAGLESEPGPGPALEAAPELEFDAAPDPGPAPDELEAGTRMGDGTAEIRTFSLLDGRGQESRRLLPGHRYTLRFEFECHAPHQDLVAGFLLRDPGGQTIYGLDSSGDAGRTVAVAADEVLGVSLSFVNHLGPGEYFISFGVGHADGRKMDYRGDAVQVVVPRRRGIYHASRADLAGVLRMQRRSAETVTSSAKGRA